MKLCGIQTLPKVAWICHAHFEKDDLHSFQCRQMMADGGQCVCYRRAQVNKGAIPKLFLPEEGQQFLNSLTARSKRIEKRDKKRLVDEILAKSTAKATLLV